MEANRGTVSESRAAMSLCVEGVAFSVIPSEKPIVVLSANHADDVRGNDSRDQEFGDFHVRNLWRGRNGAKLTIPLAGSCGRIVPKHLALECSAPVLALASQGQRTLLNLKASGT